MSHLNTSFYKSYKELMHKQYPSTKEKTSALPISSITISLPKCILNHIKNFVQTIYQLSRKTHYIKYLTPEGTQNEYPEYEGAEIKNHSVLMAYDFHLEKETQKLKLIEVNTNGSGYLISDLLDQLHLTCPNDLDQLRKSFIKEWNYFSQSKPKNVFLIDEDILEQKMHLEFLMFKDWFASWGWNMEIIEAKSLDQKLKRIETHTEVFGLVYNRLVDFYLQKFPYIKRAFLEQAICLTPHPLEYFLLSEKLRLSKWSDPQFLDSLNVTKKEKELILKTVPHSKVVKNASPAQTEELWKNRKKYFFKPLSGYGGKGVFNGKSMTKKTYLNFFKKPFLIQYIIKPDIFIDSHAKQKWKYDLRAYTYKGDVQKVTARVYQGQVTNFKTPGSGFAKVDFL